MDFNFQDLLDELSLEELKRFKNALGAYYERRVRERQQDIKDAQNALKQLLDG